MVLTLVLHPLKYVLYEATQACLSGSSYYRSEAEAFVFRGSLKTVEPGHTDHYSALYEDWKVLLEAGLQRQAAARLSTYQPTLKQHNSQS